MRHVAILCCAIIFVSVGVSSLKCNLCIGGEFSDCALGKPTAMATQTCGIAFPIVREAAPPQNSSSSVDPKIVEYCIALKLKGDNNFSTIMERGCGYIYENVDICDYIKEHIEKDRVEVCKYCSGDLCN